jgi:hypothetical protein
MVLRSKSFGSLLSHEDGALMNGISAFIKGIPESSFGLMPSDGCL